MTAFLRGENTAKHIACGGILRIEIERATCRNLCVRITPEEKKGNAKIVVGLRHARVDVYRFLKLHCGFLVFLEVEIACSEFVVRFQIAGINVESFLQVQSGRADVTREERALRMLKFLKGFG